MSGPVPAIPPASVLEVTGLSVSYGPVKALEGVDLQVRAGEIAALVGANGAGKSTLLRTLSGLIRPAAGRIDFLGKDITRAPTHKIVRSGLVQVPEGRHAFTRFTLRENLQAGAFTRRDGKRITREIDAAIEENAILKRRAGSTAGQLSGGEQQMLVIQRALMAAPTMIMLDEPSMGLSPKLADQVLDLISQLRDQGTTVLVVEQNALGALDIADRVYALASGRILYSGTAAEMRVNPHFADQFLGVVSAEARMSEEPAGNPARTDPR